MQLSFRSAGPTFEGDAVVGRVRQYLHSAKQLLSFGVEPGTVLCETTREVMVVLSASKAVSSLPLVANDNTVQ